MTRQPISNELQISDNFRWSKLALRKFEHWIVEVFETLRAYQIEPILIKGWATNLYYPDDQPRTFSDIDIAVSSRDYEKTQKILLEFSKPVSVDLHNELRHLDTCSWSTLFGRSWLTKIDNVDIRILAPEDHLRVICTHWLNDGGQYRERLWDIYYAVANRPNDFDWSVCLDSVSNTRKKWMMLTIFAAHRYLGLDISNLPFEKEVTRLPIWMEKCLEKEWGTTVRLLPMQTILGNPKKVWEQLRKRFPPNPIQATVENEGEFDDSIRFGYQMRNIINRTLPSIKRLVPALINRVKR